MKALFLTLTVVSLAGQLALAQSGPKPMARTVEVPGAKPAERVDRPKTPEEIKRDAEAARLAGRSKDLSEAERKVELQKRGVVGKQADAYIRLQTIESSGTIPMTESTKIDLSKKILTDSNLEKSIDDMAKVANQLGRLDASSGRKELFDLQIEYLTKAAGEPGSPFPIHFVFAESLLGNASPEMVSKLTEILKEANKAEAGQLKEVTREAAKRISKGTVTESSLLSCARGV